MKEINKYKDIDPFGEEDWNEKEPSEFNLWLKKFVVGFFEIIKKEKIINYNNEDYLFIYRDDIFNSSFKIVFNNKVIYKCKTYMFRSSNWDTYDLLVGYYNGEYWEGVQNLIKNIKMKI